MEQQLIGHVGRGINDVAVVVLTLSAKPEAAERYTDKDLYRIADELRAELMKVDNVGLSYIADGSPQQIRVEPDPEKLSLFGVTLAQLVAKVQGANRSFLAAKCAAAARCLNWSAKGEWVHYAKVAFEKYFLRKIRRGESEPAYERFILEKLQLRKIKEPV